MALRPPWEFEKPLCAEIGVELFYKDDTNEEDRAIVNGEQAKAALICTGCEHVFDCAEWGINRERWGVWGGLTPLQRNSIRRKRRRVDSRDTSIQLLP